MDLKAQQQLQTVKYFHQLQTAQSDNHPDEHQPKQKVRRSHQLLYFVRMMMQWLRKIGIKRKVKIEGFDTQVATSPIAQQHRL